MYIPLTLSFLKQGVFDLIDSASLETAYGHPIKAGTGWEVLGAWREAELAQRALEIVGKPGTPFGAVELLPTAMGGLGGVTWGGYRRFDHHHIPMTSELKINNDLLAIITHINNIGGFMAPYYNPIYGGHAGGAEGVAGPQRSAVHRAGQDARVRWRRRHQSIADRARRGHSESRPESKRHEPPFRLARLDR